MPPPRARAPPALPDELIEEVLLRIPPDDPASLAHAALASRRWRRLLLADPDFRRRRLALLRGAPPPMLGVLCDGVWDAGGGSGSGGRQPPSARFVPTSTFGPPPPHAAADLRGFRPLDARHGRVLLASEEGGFVVWDPITDRRVDLPPGPPGSLGNRSRKATVLCAAAATGGATVCDHRNCHGGPFVVVLVGTSNTSPTGNTKSMFSCTYSSESGAWSKAPTYYHHVGDDLATATRGALVGTTLFFALRNTHDMILMYDLGRRLMSMTRLPRVRRAGAGMVFTSSVPELTTLEDGRRLGFARVEKHGELCLWARGDAEGWTLCRVVDLKGLFRPLADPSFEPFYRLVGFAESACVAFVAAQGGLFAVDMESGVMKKVCEGRGICCAVPYISFCDPALEAPSRDDGQRVGISTGKGGRLKR